MAVTIEAHAADLQVTVDGQTHSLSSAFGGNWRGVSLEQPGPTEREYQIDGSDTTATTDRRPQLIVEWLDTPLYKLDAWLRDESSYSRWEHLRIVDLNSGQLVSSKAALPTDFQLTVALRRPEAAARLWLLGPTVDRREGLELDRDRRNARWLIDRSSGLDALPRWFFPEQPAPFAAGLLQLVGRSAAAAYVLALTAVGLGLLVARGPMRSRRLDPLPAVREVRGRGMMTPVVAGPSSRWRIPGSLPSVGVDAVLAVWLLAAALVTTRVYHQLPHILDAVSYTFQAGLLASGQFSVAAPPLFEAFKGPFEVAWHGQLFSQYPPGAPAAYALGHLVGLEWLVGPVACLALIAASTWSARQLFGDTCALAVLVLGVLSPFILFQSGSFLSHPIAGGLLAGALAAFVAAECGGAPRWYAVSGVFFGLGFVSREAASILFAIPIGLRLLLCRRWDGLTRIVAFGIPFVLLYLLYNRQLTGSPLLLPRSLFDPTDHFGFGDGIGFHMRHTLAAGLANTDELLTLLQFDVFGWPPLFAFGLLALPFLLGRAGSWDLLAAGGVLAFVAAYAAYFYHGISLGPRYYFEAMPWLLLLGGRGVQTLAELARSKVVSALLVGLLGLNTLLFYTPAEIQRRTDLSGMPGGVRISLGFVQSTLGGPRLSGVPSGSLVLTDDWWVFNTALAPLNCPQLPACDVLFALATNAEDANRLHAQYPDRQLLRAVNNGGRIDVAAYRFG